jgi:ABC-type nitrate/sulfonate/bicarbonate transport system substrate-binding protein
VTRPLLIGGVPEHFNLPWRLAFEDGAPQRLGIDAQWRDYPEGSGAMAAALRSGELDAALLLTEGAIAGIASGGGFKIASLFTESPLIWGIHVPAGSRFQSVADVQGARYAISRPGSGSHLMAFVHARARGWPTDALSFVAVRNLQGAIDAFAAGGADVFFWEKFMTKPLVDAGRFRRVGEFVAPWPAFVMCVGDAALAANGRALRELLSAAFAQAAALAASATAAALIASRYDLERADVAEWLTSTRWATRPGIGDESIASCVDALGALRLIDPDFAAHDAIARLPAD